MQNENLYLKPQEAKFLGLAVVALMDILNENANKPNVPWTPKARSANKEMLAAGTSLSIKLKKMGFNVEPFENLQDGDMDEFFTKES